MSRYVLEAEWSGYHSRQARICHREVLDERAAKPLLSGDGPLRTIQFTDGTHLHVSIRRAETREKVFPLLAYRDLIREAAALGKSYVRVADLACEDDDA